MSLVSLIVPIYNGEKTIHKCVESILKQSYSNFELILINDGSTDDTAKICDKYSKEDKRIITVNKKNEGAGPSRNVGIEMAKGDYIMFPDADDWMEPIMIEELLKGIKLNNSNLGICGSINHFEDYIETNIKISSENYYYETEQEVKENYIVLLEKGLMEGPSDKIYDLSIIKKNNIRFPNKKRSQDIFFNIDYYNYVTKICVINKGLYHYNVNSSESIVNKIPKEYFNILLELCKIWNDKKNIFGGDIDKWNNFIGNYLIGGIYISTKGLHSNKYNYSFKQQRLLLKDMLNDKFVAKVLKDYHPKLIKFHILKLLIRMKLLSVLLLLSKKYKFRS